jgi:hypothetical protein
MAETQAMRAALEAVDRLINRGGEPDEVLRATVAVLEERCGYELCAIAFTEDGELVLGPVAGASEQPPAAVPVVFEGTKVAELRISPGPSGNEERAFLERVATLISPYCLVGWDTGGEPWDP